MSSRLECIYRYQKKLEGCIRFFASIRSDLARTQLAHWFASYSSQQEGAIRTSVQQTKRSASYTIRFTEFESNLFDYCSLGIGLSHSNLVRTLISIPVFESAPNDAERYARVIVASKGAFYAILKQTRAWGYYCVQALNMLAAIYSKQPTVEISLDELLGKAGLHLDSIESLRAKVDGVVTSILEFYTTPVVERVRDDKNNRSFRASVRLSDSESESFDANSKPLGCTRSEYLRALVLMPLHVLVPEETGSFVDSIVADKELLPEIPAQTRAFGYRFNSALHALNIIKTIEFMSQEDTYDFFSSAIESLSEIETYEPKTPSSTNLRIRTS